MIQPQEQAPQIYGHEQNQATWTPTPQAYKLPGFNEKMARLTAVMQVILGCMAIVLHAIHMGLAVDLNSLGHGLWCGAIFVIAGGLMIPGAKRHNKCLIVSSMVMSIIAALAAATLISLCGTGLAFAIVTRYEMRWCIHSCIFIPVSGRVVLLCMMMLVGLVEMVVSIWTAALCCKTTCCAPVVYAEQYMVTYSGNQPVMVNNAPMGNTQQPTVIMYPPGMTEQRQCLMQEGVSAPTPAYNGQQAMAQMSAPNETKTALP